MQVLNRKIIWELVWAQKCVWAILSDRSNRCSISYSSYKLVLVGIILKFYIRFCVHICYRYMTLVRLVSDFCLRLPYLSCLYYKHNAILIYATTRFEFARSFSSFNIFHIFSVRCLFGAFIFNRSTSNWKELEWLRKMLANNR